MLKLDEALLDQGEAGMAAEEGRTRSIHVDSLLAASFAKFDNSGLGGKAKENAWKLRRFKP